LPTHSIDTFFACSLFVSVALIATAFFAGTMQTTIGNNQNLYKDSYLQAIADQMVKDSGTPENWGATAALPSNFGLANSGSTGIFDVDIDKISRLNGQNNFSLTYYNVSKAAKLSNLGFGISLTQYLQVTINQVAKLTLSGSTSYTFSIAVNGASEPTSFDLHCYIVAEGFKASLVNTTAKDGRCSISIQIPNASSGPALMLVFARAPFDHRLTAYSAYSFVHNSDETLAYSPLQLSPLNYTLHLCPKKSGVEIKQAYTFSYGYQFNLTSSANDTDAYALPKLVNDGPVISVIAGLDGNSAFVDWVSYPSIPMEFGANFAHSEKNMFTYAVIIDGSLYKLSIFFGDISK
jgi:hypothetical protein